MSISETVIKDYVQDLLKAEDIRVPIESITNKYPSLTTEDAYNIQLQLIEAKKKRTRARRPIVKSF